MKIIIEKKQRQVPSRCYTGDSWGASLNPFNTETYYEIFLNETKKLKSLALCDTLEQAEKMAGLIAKESKGEVITSWTRAYRVTTTVHARSESEALDRLCGTGDLEARSRATVITV